MSAPYWIRSAWPQSNMHHTAFAASSAAPASDAIFGNVLVAEKMYINNKELMRKYYEENRDGYWEGVIANAKAEGKAEGKAEERQTLLAAARTLLAEGMDRLKVQRVMQLTDAEMASIC